MGGDVRARLGEDEREALISAIQDGNEVEWVENLLAARAAAPDGLREAVEGVAAEFSELAGDHSERLSDFEDGYSVAMTDAAHLTIAVLAAHPAPGGGA